MSKFKVFFEKAAADDSTKKELEDVLNGKKLGEATDGQLAEISDIAKRLGVDITDEEMKEFASGNRELEDDELDAVAGGFDSHGRPECAQDWLELACEVQEEYVGDYIEAAKTVAARHNIDDYTKVYDNWVWFNNMVGEDFYSWY